MTMIDAEHHESSAMSYEGQDKFEEANIYALLAIAASIERLARAVENLDRRR